MEPRPPGTEPPLPRGPGPGPEPELEPEPERDLEREPEPDLEHERDLVPEPHLDLEQEPELEREPELDLEPDLEPEPELDLEPEPELDLEPELEPEPELDLEPEPELDLEPELEPEPELEQEADLEPELDLDLWALEPAAPGAGPPPWCPGEAEDSPGPGGPAEPPPEEEPRLRPVFDALDRDGDGFVRVEEFVQFATAYGAEQVSTGHRHSTCPPRAPGRAASGTARCPVAPPAEGDGDGGSCPAPALGERQCPRGQRWHRPVKGTRGPSGSPCAREETEPPRSRGAAAPLGARGSLFSITAAAGLGRAAGTSRGRGCSVPPLLTPHCPWATSIAGSIPAMERGDPLGPFQSTPFPGSLVPRLSRV